MTLPADAYRRQNAAAGKAAMLVTVHSRKREWKEAGLLDDIGRQRLICTLSAAPFIGLTLPVTSDDLPRSKNDA